MLIVHESGFEGNPNSGCTEIDPCDDVTEVSVPANAHCTSYYSECPSKCKAWACDDDYTKSGNTCIQQCVPEDCVPSGYVSFSSCPPHGACDYCEPGCGEPYRYWLADGCDSGYELNSSGTGCVEIPSCTYTTTASYCSDQCKNVGSLSCKKNGTTYYNGCGSSKCGGSTPYCRQGECVECTDNVHCPSWHRCVSGSCEWDLDDQCSYGSGIGQEIVCNETSTSATLCCCPRNKLSCSNSACSCYDINF